MAALFYNREEAGRQLAEKLEKWSGTATIILGIPRGGVAIGYPIAQKLGARLDVVIPRKIRAPYNPEVAIGAVTHDGEIILNEPIVNTLGISERYIKNEVERAKAEIERRIKKFRGQRPQPEIQGQTVIIVDDGMATGFTVQAAIRALRRHDPARLILAVPVAPPETVERLRPEVDELVCLATPASFQAVAQFYRLFHQISDEEVIFMLNMANTPSP